MSLQSHPKYKFFERASEFLEYLMIFSKDVFDIDTIQLAYLQRKLDNLKRMGKEEYSIIFHDVELDCDPYTLKKIYDVCRPRYYKLALEKLT